MSWPWFYVSSDLTIGSCFSLTVQVQKPVEADGSRHRLLNAWLGKNTPAILQAVDNPLTVDLAGHLDSECREQFY